ncbi:MAG: CDP-alcohol phosphatidyltransferase family protein [Chloroflexi bacterium]|nr:CDP-alcohol phosphatidyltransferase family protein [Chloroflexota bacterium]MCI0576842.1 CDP-alcohol phosphatidyltransferase family protein [Chloroflexota bacterium]MCI0649447.1 CDP-alcohol phosphatidyltransferase family protein [Chloroflexota bacterium]MCI0730753.1 CDP-alcohol phosphatidyltransferase family protein [Chloroflexota bacterium]
MTHTTSQTSKPTLTDFLRARTAGVVNPVVAALARLGLSPDVLTVTGMLAHILFAWLIATGRLQLAGVAIAVLSPLDALDGALARKLGRQQGNFGAFLDSTLDRLAEIALFAGYILYYNQPGNSWMVATAYLALTGSLMVSYARSRAEALGIPCKVGILTRVERYVVIVLTLLLNVPAYGLAILAVFTYVTLAQRMVHVWRATRNSSQEA